MIFPSALAIAATAHRGRARPVSAETKGAARGVAVDDLHEAARHAEHVADELGEHRLMALAVTMRTREDGDIAGGIDADRSALEQTAACPKLTGDTRGCQAAGRCQVYIRGTRKGCILGRDCRSFRIPIPGPFPAMVV